MRRPNIKDIALLTGLSVATIDRAINNRGSVSNTAKDKIALAIGELNYRAPTSPLFERKSTQLRFKFILPPARNSFSSQIVRAVTDAHLILTDVELTIDIVHVDLEDSTAVIAAIDAVDERVHVGAALFAVDGPGIRNAIDRLVDRGVKVVTVVTDIPTSKRHYFVGINNPAAGRLAASLMGKLCSGRTGKVGIITGSIKSIDQNERIATFKAVMAERYPNLRLMPPKEGFSKSELNRKITRELINKHYDLVGIYTLSAGQSGTLNALHETMHEDRPIIIMHEMSERIARDLRAGSIDAVISQNPGHIARSSVRILKALHFTQPIVGSQEKIRTEIYMAENVEDWLE